MDYKREINYHDYEYYNILSAHNFQFIMCLYNFSGQIVCITGVKCATLPSCWINNGQPNLAHQKRKPSKVCTQSQH